MGSLIKGSGLLQVSCEAAFFIDFRIADIPFSSLGGSDFYFLGDSFDSSMSESLVKESLDELSASSLIGMNLFTLILTGCKVECLLALCDSVMNVE